MACLVDSPVMLDNGQDYVRFESSEHGKSLLAGLRDLRQMQLLFDVVLVAENKEFPAHRVVLASCSDYFRAMFTDGLRECSESRIVLNGLTASSVAHLLDFAYNSTINIDSDNVLDVLSSATYVHILPVVTACENYLCDHLTTDNCISTASVAELFSLRPLQQHTLSFICRHWSTVSNTKEFCQLSSQFLVHLLSSGYPVDCKEYDVLTSVLRWFSFSASDRSSDILTVLDCILVENVCDEDLAIVLSSVEWMQLSKAFPSLHHYFSSLSFLRRCNISSSCVSESDNILDMHDTNREKTCPFGKSKTKSSCKISHHPPGLSNLRGYQPTLVVAGGFHKKISGFHKEAGMTNNLMQLDPSSGQFKILTKIPHLDQINFGLTVFKNHIFVVGGCFIDQMQEVAHPFGYRFNPSTEQWVSIAPMHQERCRFLLCATEDRIYAIGGDPCASDIGSNDIAPCEVYCPELDDWKPIAPLPGNRSQLAGTACGKYLAISGGIQENTEHVFDDFYLYDPNFNSWEKKKNMLSGRTDHSMFVWEGSVYVVGGWCLDRITSKRVMATTIDRYDFGSDSWQVVATVDSPRTFGTYTLAGDKVYAIGGWKDDNRFQKCEKVEIFDMEHGSWLAEQDQKLSLWEHAACWLYLPKYSPGKKS